MRRMRRRRVRNRSMEDMCAFRSTPGLNGGKGQNCCDICCKDCTELLYAFRCYRRAGDDARRNEEEDDEEEEEEEEAEDHGGR